MNDGSREAPFGVCGPHWRALDAKASIRGHVAAYTLEFTRADVERLRSVVETARVVQVAYFPATGTWSLRLVDGYTTDRRCEYCAREVARRQGYEKMLVERDNRIKELERQLKEAQDGQGAGG